MNITSCKEYFVPVTSWQLRNVMDTIINSHFKSTHRASRLVLIGYKLLRSITVHIYNLYIKYMLYSLCMNGQHSLVKLLIIYTM